MEIIVFEDQGADALAPATLTRSAMAVSCGGYRLVDQLLPVAERYGGALRAVVRPFLRSVVSEDFPSLGGGGWSPTAPLWFVNARLVPSAKTVNALETFFRQGCDGVVHSGESIAAARISTIGIAESEFVHGKLPEAIRGTGLPAIEVDLPLLTHPHDIVRWHVDTIGENLKHRVACDGYQEKSDGVFLADAVDCASAPQIAETAVFDTASGVVVIERDASIGPHTTIIGPCHIGAGAKVAPGALLKGKVALGHTTKAGGEIEGAIFEPYSNKQHEGVLGYSYLGSWINIGAGTNQSDLKNTYGSIRAEYDGVKIDTGMQFFGSVMGDYTKTAINTGIFTGKVIGVASTLYGLVTENVPSFVNHARSLGQQGEIPADVAITTQRRMFARRGVRQRACDEKLLRDVFAMTAPERRGMSAEPLKF